MFPTVFVKYYNECRHYFSFFVITENLKNTLIANNFHIYCKFRKKTELNSPHPHPHLLSNFFQEITDMAQIMTINNF